MRTPDTEKDFSWEPPYGHTIELPLAVPGKVLAPILRAQLSHLLFGHSPKSSDPKEDDRIVYTFSIVQCSFIRQQFCDCPLALAIREILYADKEYGRVRIAFSCWKFHIASFGRAWRPVPINDDNLTLRVMCKNLHSLILPQIRWAQTQDG